MEFTENFEIFQIINFLGFLIGLLFGIIAQKNQFCFSGSIKDYILTNSTRRAASVITAIITAVISTYLMATYFEFDLNESIYYKENLNYFSLILGSISFGSGMIIADGCSSRHLIKFSQGDPYSIVTILFIGIFAYATTQGILYELISYISKNEYLINLSAKVDIKSINIFILVAFLALALRQVTKKPSRVFELYDGVLIGLLVACGWYITSILGEQSIERFIKFESLSFVYPTGNTLEFITQYNTTNLTFSISIILGVLCGAFLMAKKNKKYSFGCTSNLQRNKIKYNMIGGAMMGTGGVLAIGCTVGQGLTGLSTLAFSSFIAIVSILGSGYITAVFLAKKDQLPMCFIFEWKDEQKI